MAESYKRFFLNPDIEADFSYSLRQIKIANLIFSDYPKTFNNLNLKLLPFSRDIAKLCVPPSGSGGILFFTGGLSVCPSVTNRVRSIT